MMTTVPLDSWKLHREACCCSICLQLYQDPRILQCGHTFCRQCIEDWHTKGEEDNLICPKCRGETPLPSRSVSTLSRNFQVIELLEMVKSDCLVQSSERDRKLLCDACDDDDDDKQQARFHCDDCNINMCEPCKDHHKTEKLFKDHATSRLELHQCKLHPQQVLLYYCEPCKVRLCPICATKVAHKGHNKSHFSDVEEKCKLELESVLPSIAKDLYMTKKEIELLMESEAELEEVSNEIVRQADARREEIDRWAKEKRAETDEWMKKSMEVVSTEKQRVQTLLGTKQVDNVTLEGVSDSIRSLFADSPDLLVLQSSGLTAEFHSLKNERITQKKRITLEAIKQMDLESPLPSLKIATIPFNEKAKTGDRSVFEPCESPQRQKPELVWKCDSKGNNKGQLQYPFGIAFMSDGNIIVADNSNHRLQVFDVNTGLSLRTIGDGQLTPIDVTVVGDCIYATDEKNNCVQLYTATGVHKQSWGKGKYSLPYGITSLMNGNIAVTDRTNSTVTIHDNNTGDIITCFGQIVNGLRNPRFIAQDSNGRIIISDLGDSAIKIYDSDFNIIKVITETEKDKKLQWPNGIAVDSNDNILLAMCGDPIVVKFESSGRYLGTVLTRKEGSIPTGITLSPTGHLALCDFNPAAIKLFTYQ